MSTSEVLVIRPHCTGKLHAVGSISHFSLRFSPDSLDNNLNKIKGKLPTRHGREFLQVL